MNFNRHIRRSCAIVLLAVAAQTSAQTGTAPAPAPGAGTAPVIEPEALEAMDRMSAALRAMPKLRFDADTTMEEVLETGQKLQFGGKLEMAARKPNGFKIIAAADTVHREFYYNGRTFAMYAPRYRYYAEVPAPPSIGQTIDKAKTEYGIELPLVDLFLWDSDQTIRSRIRSAFALRPETIEGRSCFHYAFRQEKVDWQIWIEEGERALPCKMIVTNTEDPSLPQYVAVLHWRDASTLGDGDFTFTPPADARRIDMPGVARASAQGETK